MQESYYLPNSYLEQMDHFHYKKTLQELER